MHLKFKVIAFFLFSLIVLTGCSSTDSSPVKESSLKSGNGSDHNVENISQKLELYMNKEKGAINPFAITDLKNIKELKDVYFVHYNYKLNELEYEGIAYLEKDNKEINISRTEEVIINKDSQVTNLMATGDVNNTYKRYVITAGTVNDPDIDTILVTYVNQNNVFFKLSPTKRSFLDIQVEDIGAQKIGLEQVIGLDSERKEIYKRVK